MSLQGERVSKVEAPDVSISLRGTLNCIFVVCAWLSAIGSIILCALWASIDAPTFLGRPSWSTNKLAWHAILSTCGFFVAQVFALTAWSIFSQTSPIRARIYIIFWSLLGTATLTGTLKAAYDDYNSINLPNMTSAHAWLGIAAAAMYYFKVLLALLYLAFPDSFSWLAMSIKPSVEMSAFFMTVVAIGTGVMIFQGETGCFYSSAAASPDYNPALNYTYMPVGCKISNGLSITVLTSALFVFYAVMLRYELVNMPSIIRSNVDIGAETSEVKKKKSRHFLWQGVEGKESGGQDTVGISGDQARAAEARSAVVL